jgi:hypothetical protein
LSLTFMWEFICHKRGESVYCPQTCICMLCHIGHCKDEKRKTVENELCSIWMECHMYSMNVWYSLVHKYIDFREYALCNIFFLWVCVCEKLSQVEKLGSTKF